MSGLYIQTLAKMVGGGTTLFPTTGLPSKREVDALGRALGVAFPDDYRTFLGAVGSLFVQVSEDIWPRPDIGSIGPHWQQTQFELKAYGVCSEVDWMRIDEVTRAFREDTGTDLAPVLQFTNTSDCICFTPKGKLVTWNRHEGAVEIDESFEEALFRLIEEQRGWKDVLLKEGTEPPTRSQKKPTRSQKKPTKPRKKPPTKAPTKSRRKSPSKSRKKLPTKAATKSRKKPPTKALAKSQKKPPLKARTKLRGRKAR